MKLARTATLLATALLFMSCSPPSAEFWLGLQMDYELDVESDRLKGTLEKEIRLLLVPGIVPLGSRI